MLSPLIIEDAVKTALKEDLGHGFDATSDLLIPANRQATGSLRARAPGRLAGLVLALSAFSYLDSDFEMSVNINDGEDVGKDEVIAEITGPARAMLTGERTALNFLTHLSGIATLTAAYVEAVRGSGVEICDTRKTLPGLRTLQKYAVTMGGGANHRFGLDDAILIKDNHIAVAGGVKAALDQVQMLAGHMRRIEIEIETLGQLEQALRHGGADIIMLDNMDIKTMTKAVKMAKGEAVLEASGGVSLANVRKIAETGIDYISIGALTHSAPALDIGLDVEV